MNRKGKPQAVFVDVYSTAQPWPQASQTRRIRYSDGSVLTWHRDRQDLPWLEMKGGDR